MEIKNNNQEAKKGFFRPSLFATLLILFTLFYIVYSHAQPTSGNSIASTSSSTTEDVQIVKIHVEGARYIMEPSTVKVGQTVRLVADISRMPGCSKGIVMSELGIRKTFTDLDNTLEFTPTKAGTFNIACSMNMYKGTLTILQEDGTKPNYVQPASTGGMTCGAGGGGCGCGGSR